MIYFFLFCLLAVGSGIYISMFSLIPGALDERLGVFDALPSNLGEWYEDPELKVPEADPTGVLCEVRYLLQTGGLLSRDVLVKQVRLRSRDTGEIVKVLPELRVARKRKRA